MILDNVRAEALAQVLAGRSVKDVASETGVPAPTLYQMARKAREKGAAHDNVQPAVQADAQVQDSAILKLLAAQLNAAAAQLNVTPTRLLAALSARLSANA